ncbi:hypothetical protein CMT52_17970 [Elizabethkingia anophelis]|uniref:hypothetical protein n=1 Tax=Elizabethkingia anophelis TaxID=1117645 RepID=UPI000B351D5A|nr:hypothetical protein [Elizabethkingia anophelis]MCL1690411.1 hypothetical protein [Elizabethkingia anophelis]MCT4261622.1 hypothetical protein [Elizabethkingia anophelis]MDV4026222.1 hypothetical protein [Elizabethkingia anophelis]
MACNCSKPLEQSDCERIKEHSKDGRSFIFHIFDDDRGLRIALVPPGESPNQIAINQNFFNTDGNLEWFNVKEHPCAYENL